MTPAELRQNLSTNKKMYRKKLSLTQEKLAEKSELSSQTINDIEGCRTWVSDKSLVKISEVLCTTPSALLLSKNPTGTEEASLDESNLYRLKSQIDSVFDEWLAKQQEAPPAQH